MGDTEIKSKFSHLDRLKQMADQFSKATAGPNITNATTQNPNTDQTEGDDLGSGEIVGIIIGVLAGIAIVFVILFILYRRRLLPGRSRKPDTVIFSFDTSFQNLIDCSNRSVRGDGSLRSSSNTERNQPDLASNTSSMESNISYRAPRTPRRSSNTSLNSGRYSSAPGQEFKEPDSRYFNIPERRSYQTSPQYIPNPNYLTESRLNYKPYTPSYTPRSFYYAPNDFSPSNFYYRPSRHIDRQIMAYYNWAINEELPEPPRAYVHQHRPTRVPRQ